MTEGRPRRGLAAERVLVDVAGQSKQRDAVSIEWPALLGPRCGIRKQPAAARQEVGWGRPDSNRRPPTCGEGATTTALRARSRSRSYEPRALRRSRIFEGDDGSLSVAASQKLSQNPQTVIQPPDQLPAHLWARCGNVADSTPRRRPWTGLRPLGGIAPSWGHRGPWGDGCAPAGA